jgi:hypothetical protein
MDTLFGRICVLMAIAVCSVSVFGQSGRRGPDKPSPVPPPAPTPEKIAAPTKHEVPPIPLLLAMDQPNVFDNPPSYIYGIVFEACVERLNHAREVALIPVTERLSRHDAIKMAKLQKEKFVVWLEVGNNASETGRAAAEDVTEFFVGYMILEPETAKVKKGGRQRHRTDQAENGEILRPGSPRGLRNAERVYKEAGYAVAERILEIFGVRP